MENTRESRDSGASMRHSRLGGAFRGERCSQSCSTGCWSIEKLCCSREKAEEEERISCANK